MAYLVGPAEPVSRSLFKGEAEAIAKAKRTLEVILLRWDPAMGGSGRWVGEDEQGKGRNGLLPKSMRIFSSCLRTVSSNAGSVVSSVRSAGASIAASIAAPPEDEKDQVLWAGFDKLELGPSSFKHVLLLGYSNGFQVFDVEDASSVCELVSKRDGPATFLQMQPMPIKSESIEGLRASHPLLLVVAGDETNGTGVVQAGHLSASMRENKSEPRAENSILIPTAVWFYSLKSHSYVHVLKFKSAVYMVRSSPRIVAVLFATQILCFDAVTLKQKFSVLTYPLQGAPGVNIGYGPMTVGSRWLAYASDNPLVPNSGHLSPQNLTLSPGVSPSTSPSSGNLVARYAMESSKTLAAGIRNLGDMSYKTWSKYCQEILPDGCTSPLSSNLSRRSGRHPPTSHPSESNNAGMVIQDISFSHYSQWISIVSSKGTCHIYVLSPFGGDASLQPQNVNGEGPILTPNLTSPWWSATCCMMHQQSHAPPHPPPITYSVVSRIKNVNSSWLSTVSSVAASAAGKTFGSSGAVAALFHNSLYHDLSPVSPKANSLEHLLVYSPSGLVIQYELLLSSFVEPCDSSLKAIPAPLLQLQDEELHVNAEPVQWWDACRRSNWPQREEDVSIIIFNNEQDSETVIDSGDCKDNGSSCILPSANGVPGTESMGSERSWYFSNAEVQISSGKVPVWQKSKICFCLLDPPPAFEGCAEDLTHGEIEIEKLSFSEVEIRQKDLLPVFKQFHGFQSDWNGRVGGRYQTSSSGLLDPSNGPRITEGLLDLSETRPYEPVSLPLMEKSIPNESRHGLSSVISNDVDALSEFKASAVMPIKCSAKSCIQLNSKNTDNYPVKDDSLSNDSNSSHCEIEKTEEDGDNVNMLGGVFAFSEEASNILSSYDVKQVDGTRYICLDTKRWRAYRCIYLLTFVFSPFNNAL
ncbi:hypothetical protein MUK42_14956 [Musa troglodytarum]|uniref:BCAS3 domain-containing protein n=1 Tax=Musa troglodytarum TaxID=320322 RepID=A0A9E7LFN8_9LILI|nr:hypothetical protein MUK42_14956 [Musa troglodytarum]